MTRQQWVKRLSRRHAAGIDISGNQVRAIVLSVSKVGEPILCLEHLGAAALPTNAHRDIEIDDPAAFAQTIMAALEGWAKPGAARWSLPAAMAVPLSTVLIAPLDPARLAELMRAAPVAAGSALQAAVAAEAERLFGIERSELAVDWLSAGNNHKNVPLQLVATLRRHVDVRLETAAQAGLRLASVDIDTMAAVRACRFATTRLFDDNAVTVGLYRHTHGESLFVAGMRRAPQEPACSLSADALQEMAALRPAALIVAGGDHDVAPPPATLPETLSDTLGCQLIRFNAVDCCDAVKNHGGNKGGDRYRSDSACYAVAFGLALRALSR